MMLRIIFTIYFMWLTSLAIHLSMPQDNKYFPILPHSFAPFFPNRFRKSNWTFYESVYISYLTTTAKSEADVCRRISNPTDSIDWKQYNCSGKLFGANFSCFSFISFLSTLLSFYFAPLDYLSRSIGRKYTHKMKINEKALGRITEYKSTNENR